MPTRYHERGTFILRRRFRGVGAIRRSSGTHDLAMFQKLDRMLLALYDQGRLDLLRAIQQQRLTPLEVWEQFRMGRLDVLPSADVFPHLASRWAEWLGTAETSSSNRIARARAWLRLRPFIPDDGNLTALVPALRDCRAEYADRPRSFNLTRAAALAFVRDQLGKHHALWSQVANVPALAARRSVQPRPLRPDQLHALLVALPPSIRPAVWTMAVTGAGPKEYMEDGIEVGIERVEIHGQKRVSRTRIVPLIPTFCIRESRIECRVQPAKFSRTYLRKLFKPHAGDRSLYDLRRTYANLLVEAGIPANRRRHYLGHEPQSMTALYERPEISSWLREDGAALARLLSMSQ